MGIVLLIPGLILDLAGKHWFSGAHEVGVILIVSGIALVLIQLLFALGALHAIFRR